MTRELCVELTDLGEGLERDVFVDWQFLAEGYSREGEPGHTGLHLKITCTLPCCNAIFCSCVRNEGFHGSERQGRECQGAKALECLGGGVKGKVGQVGGEGDKVGRRG